MYHGYSNGAADAQGGGAAPPRITTVDFLKKFFEHTTAQVYICSFPNERGDEKQVGERHAISRKPAEITAFLESWDKPKRGAFFCVATLKPDAWKRNKENVFETIALHVDIDFKHVDLLGANPLNDVLRHLARLRILPSITVASGGGVHAYWLLKEPMETQGNIERIEAVLRQLADIVAGDLSVCEVSRVMRLPGTHNTKNGAWKEVEVTSFHPERRYEFDDIEEWLSEQSPVMLRRSRERAKTAGERMTAHEPTTGSESDFFADFAKRHGIKPPINVERRLRAMMYMAGGENSIHITQLSVTASLLNAGVPVDDVVERVLGATRAAAGEYGARWNWRREGRKIRRMCETWLKKHPSRNRKRPEAR
jgi:hypothetical protein